MDVEFHYYTTKYLAMMAGFEEDEAEIIAYSSQYVDDNVFSLEIANANGEIYHNYLTQTNNILKPVRSLMRVYLLYHFIPGDPLSQRARRADGKMHLLMTTPGSRNAENILYEAIKQEDLYMIGIASHSFADTFCHQNFIGTFDEINAFKGVPHSLIPNIGHADVGIKPDIPNLVWNDVRLIESHRLVDNNERILQAAKNLYSNYLLLTSFTNKWNFIKEKLEEILAPAIQENEIDQNENLKKIRIKKIKSLISRIDEDTELDYDKNRWFKQCIKQDIKLLDDTKYSFDPIKDKFTFKDKYQFKHWYKFQESVKKYQKMAYNKLRPVLDQVEIYNW